MIGPWGMQRKKGARQSRATTNTKAESQRRTRGAGREEGEGEEAEAEAAEKETKTEAEAEATATAAAEEEKEEEEDQEEEVKEEEQEEGRRKTSTLPVSLSSLADRVLFLLAFSPQSVLPVVYCSRVLRIDELLRQVCCSVSPGRVGQVGLSCCLVRYTAAADLRLGSSEIVDSLQL